MEATNKISVVQSWAIKVKPRNMRVDRVQQWSNLVNLQGAMCFMTVKCGSVYGAGFWVIWLELGWYELREFGNAFCKVWPLFYIKACLRNIFPKGVIGNKTTTPAIIVGVIIVDPGDLSFIFESMTPGVVIGEHVLQCIDMFIWEYGSSWSVCNVTPHSQTCGLPVL